MSISIEGIKFNYDPDLSTTGAINLRRNENQVVPIPEWQPGSCSNHECSPAAYRRNAVPDPMQIQASFFVDGVLEAPLKIKGVASIAGHILGDTSEEIIPSSGSSGFVTFELSTASLSTEPVGVYDIGWRWHYLSYRDDGEPFWTQFQETNHRIYSILSDPTEPWEWNATAEGNIHIPWAEVLDVACDWATGATTPDEAAAAITSAVYNLGTGVVTDSGSPVYALITFHCTEFLELLRGEVGRGHTVNCDDCATVVSTFANLLGCSLSQSGMGLNFDTHEVIEIGKLDFQPEGYLRHAVAWKGECDKNDELFDAFLEVDGAGAPGGEQEPLLPANIQFGDQRSEQYHFRLVASGQCEPRKIEKKRRLLGKKLLGEEPIADVELLAKVKAHYRFDEWSNDENITFRGENNDILRSSIFQLRESGWRVEVHDERRSERFQRIIELIAQISDTERRNMLSTIIYECGEAVAPNELLAELLTSFTTRDIERVSDFREPAFSEGGGRCVIFRRGPFVVLIRSAGKDEITVLRAARFLYRSLL
jgi:hypothetical protein